MVDYVSLIVQGLFSGIGAGIANLIIYEFMFKKMLQRIRINPAALDPDDFSK